jgi:4-amino-4-deoxy-L-arabinose transferase-like glycosyltransferase
VKRFRELGTKTRDSLVLGIAAALVYGIQAIAWPVAGGRDWSSWLLYYLQMFHGDPVYPKNMLTRAPVPGLFYGPLLQVGGTTLVEVLLGFAWIAAILVMYRIGSYWGRRAGIAAALLLLVYTPYGALFHQVSSDPPFAFLFLLWIWLLCDTWVRPTVVKFALSGAFVALLVLTRPAEQIFVIFALAPILMRGRAWAERLRYAAAFLAASIVLLVAIAGYNDARYGEFVITRGSNAVFPFYRLWVDGLIKPSNGPSTRKLADAVERDLLTKRPYSAYGITKKKFFKAASDRMYVDLTVLVDQKWGWASNYAIMRDAGLEGVQAHPGGYAKAVGWTLWHGLIGHSTWRAPTRYVERVAASKPKLVLINGHLVPKPSGGEPIPSSRILSAFNSTPDGNIYIDWSSLAHPVERYRNPATYPRAQNLERQLSEFRHELPTRNGSTWLANRMNDISSIYPRTIIWLAIGLAALFWRRPKNGGLLLILVGLAFALLFLSALGLPSLIRYRVPLDPAFILLAAAAVFGPGTPRRWRRSGDPPTP